MKLSNGLILLAFLLVSCSSPEGASANVVRGFMRAMSDGNSDRAMNMVCSSGVTILPNLAFDWQNDRYETSSIEEDLAFVHMTGDSRLTESNWQKWGRELGVPLPALVSARFALDFTWRVEKQGNTWCIPELSLSEFLLYLVQVFQDEIQ